MPIYYCYKHGSYTDVPIVCPFCAANNCPYCVEKDARIKELEDAVRWAQASFQEVRYRSPTSRFDIVGFLDELLRKAGMEEK